MKCLCCGEKEVYIKKRGLCYTCYARLRAQGKLDELDGPSDQSKKRQEQDGHIVMHKKEINFIKRYFDHGNWLYEPATFSIGYTTYTPDFYDQINNVFIEVVGSRQAYHKNKDKYELFREMYPKIKFEVRTSDGNLLNNEKPDWRNSAAKDEEQ